MARRIAPKPEGRPCPKSGLYNTWNDFEIELIDYVKKNPILYDPLTRTSKERERSILDMKKNLWRYFATKCNYTEDTVKCWWNMIRSNYFKIKREQNTSSPAYQKYMDGRLSFLEHEINISFLEHEINKKRTKNNSNTEIKTDSNNSSATDVVIDLEKEPVNGIIEDKTIAGNEQFNDFELMLIDFVKKYPVIYDPKVISDETATLKSHCINRHFDRFSQETTVSVNFCIETWNRIKIEYYRVRTLQDGKNTQQTSFHKYLDGKFNFLEPTYQIIKVKSLNIFNIEPKELDEEIDKCLCFWTDFQLSVIKFVKQHPIFYDHRTMLFLSREHLLAVRKRLWEELASTWKTTTERCVKCWIELRDRYQYYMKNKEQHITNYPEFNKKQYEILSFIDNYNITHPDSLRDNNRESKLQRPANENKNKCETSIELDGDKPSTSKDFQTVHALVPDNESESMTEKHDDIIVKEGSKNIFDTTNEFDKNEVQTDCTVVTDDEDTNYMSVKQYLEHPEGMKNKRKRSKSMTEENENIVNSMKSKRYRMTTNDLFKEIGEYVTDRFPKNKQNEIRLKTLALLTQIELNMLRE